MGIGHQSVAVARSASSSAGRDSNLTVAELVDRYMAAYAGRDDSRGSRLGWWVGQIGSIRLADLDDDAIFHALETLASGQGRHYTGRDADGKPILKGKGKPPSPATVNRYAAALGAVCTWAIRRRLVPKGWASPCRRIERRPEDNERVRFLSDDERERLLTACRASKWGRLYLLVLMAITTGGRRGELVNLRWRDVDLEQGTAQVARSKNGDAKVHVLVPAVLELLKAIEPRPPGALLFASRIRPDQPYAFAALWTQALKAARVKNFRFHDLRHSCASYLAQSGATLLEIADVLGHRNLSVTKRYSHLTVEHKRKLVTRVLGDLK